MSKKSIYRNRNATARNRIFIYLIRTSTVQSNYAILCYPHVIYSKNGFTYGVKGGTGPVWLDNIRCHGNETDIQFCNLSGWDNNTYCDHGNDIGLTCCKCVQKLTTHLEQNRDFTTCICLRLPFFLKSLIWPEPGNRTRDLPTIGGWSTTALPRPVNILFISYKFVKGFLAIFFYSLIFLAETFTMCVNVFLI